MKKIILFCALFFTLYAFAQNPLYIRPFANHFSISVPSCESYADGYDYDDIPQFAKSEWLSSSNFLRGDYKKQYYQFSDGVGGYLFLGGASGKYFISSDSDDRLYFKNWSAAVRGLYIYKRFGCFTKYGRD